MITIHSTDSDMLREIFLRSGEPSLRAFAKRVGVPVSTISRVLNCRRCMTFDVLVRVAMVYELPVAYIIGHVGYEVPPGERGEYAKLV